MLLKATVIGFYILAATLVYSATVQLVDILATYEQLEEQGRIVDRLERLHGAPVE